MRRWDELMMMMMKGREIKSTNASYRLATVKGQSTFIILLAHYETDAVISFHFIWIFFTSSSSSHFRDSIRIRTPNTLWFVVVDSIRTSSSPKFMKVLVDVDAVESSAAFWTISVEHIPVKKIRKCLHNEDYGVFGSIESLLNLELSETRDSLRWL